MGELILLLGDEFHHLRKKQKGKKVGESVEIQLQIIHFLLKSHSQFPHPQPKKKVYPKGV